MRDINQIIVHCSDTYVSMDIGVDDIRTWHVRDNGWDDVGYHHVIKRDGTVERGREHDIIGAHARGMNENSLGVCVVGGKGDDGKPDVNFTAAQWKALHDVVFDLKWKYGGNIIGHCNVPNSGKSCPNFNVLAWAEELGEQK